MELSYTKYPATHTLEGFWNENKPALLAYLRAVHSGVHGFVHDADGNPVEALISVKDTDTLVATARGFQPAEQTVTVQALHASQPLPFLSNRYDFELQPVSDEAGR